MYIGTGCASLHPRPASALHHTGRSSAPREPARRAALRATTTIAPLLPPDPACRTGPLAIANPHPLCSMPQPFVPLLRCQAHPPQVGVVPTCRSRARYRPDVHTPEASLFRGQTTTVPPSMGAQRPHLPADSVVEAPDPRPPTPGSGHPARRCRRHSPDRPAVRRLEQQMRYRPVRRPRRCCPGGRRGLPSSSSGGGGEGRERGEVGCWRWTCRSI
jgi:hypothetical protein